MHIFLQNVITYMGLSVFFILKNKNQNKNLKKSKKFAAELSLIVTRRPPFCRFFAAEMFWNRWRITGKFFNEPWHIKIICFLAIHPKLLNFFLYYSC